MALLTDDAWLTMPPAPNEYHGAEAIAGFLRASATGRAGRRLGLQPTRANAQPAFACYLGQPDAPAAHPSGLAVLTLSGDRIAAITRFLDSELPSIFGFGNVLAGTGGRQSPEHRLLAHTRLLRCPQIPAIPSAALISPAQNR